MSRLKTALARSRRIALNKLRRRESHVVLGLADDVMRCVALHTSKGHLLRLKVGDDMQMLECTVCEMPVVEGSDNVMKAVMEHVNAYSIEFEVLSETEACF